jgi:hypothetical protein
VFLVINSKDQEDRLASNPAAICRGQAELMGFIKGWGPGQTWTVMELGTSIHALSLALAKTLKPCHASAAEAASSKEPG